MKLTHFIFAFVALFISIAVGSEIVEVKPTVTGGKLFCAQPGKSYCLNVVDYPRDRLNMLFKDVIVDNSDA